MTKQNYNTSVSHDRSNFSKINNNPLIPLNNSFSSDLLSWNVYSTPWQQVQGSAINICTAGYAFWPHRHRSMLMTDYFLKVVFIVQKTQCRINK